MNNDNTNNIYEDLTDDEFLEIISLPNLPTFITQSVYVIQRLQDIINTNITQLYITSYNIILALYLVLSV